MSILGMLNEYDLMTAKEKEMLVDVGQRFFLIDFFSREIAGAKSGAFRAGIFVGIVFYFFVLFLAPLPKFEIAMGVDIVLIIVLVANFSIIGLVCQLTARWVKADIIFGLKKLVAEFHKKYHKQLKTGQDYSLRSVLRFLKENNAMPASALRENILCHDCSERLRFEYL